MSFIFDSDETPYERAQRLSQRFDAAPMPTDLGSGMSYLASAVAARMAQRQGGYFPPAPQDPQMQASQAPGGFPAAPALPIPAMGSTADVYGGKAGSGVANGGAVVSRDGLGNIGVRNGYGVTSYTNADGRSVAYLDARQGIANVLMGQRTPAELDPPVNPTDRVRTDMDASRSPLAQASADAAIRGYAQKPSEPSKPFFDLRNVLGGLLGMGSSKGGLYWRGLKTIRRNHDAVASGQVGKTGKCARRERAPSGGARQRMAGMRGQRARSERWR